MFLTTSNSSNLGFLYLVSVFDGHWLVCLTGKMAGYPVSAASWLLSLQRCLLAVAQLLDDS